MLILVAVDLIGFLVVLCLKVYVCAQLILILYFMLFMIQITEAIINTIHLKRDVIQALGRVRCAGSTDYVTPHT